MTARMSNENQTPETEDAELTAEADAAQAADAEQEAPASEEPDPAEEISNLKDQLLRALAEMENTKKRAEREVKDTRAYAVTGFARDMLDVADNLSRALQSISDESKSEAGEALKTLLEGVEMTERRLLSSLERHGVKKVEPAPGDALDPNMHQAAAQIPADQPKGAIAHVMQPGYKIGDRTLRAAMVVVSAGPATPPAGGENEGGVDVSA